MNVNKSSLFWGILLIGGGGLALARQFGYLDQLPDSIWMWIFTFVSVVAFLAYALSGFREWGWLFPAGVFGGLAAVIGFAVSGYDNPAMASPLFFGLLIPFAAAYLADRTRHWWALIPGGIMLFLAMVLLLVDNVSGEWIGTMFLFFIGLAFFIVYMNNRSRWWALLVAYILFVLSLAPALASGGDTAAYFGPIFLFAVALPFFVLYFRGEDNWWAIIPSGVLTTLAIIAGAAITGWIKGDAGNGYANAFLLFGFTVTFAVVWLRNAKQWAKGVTIVLAVLTIASIFFAAYTEIFWPVAFIISGAYLLFITMKPKNELDSAQKE